MAMNPKEIERVYDGYARVYDRIFGSILQGPREMAIRSLDIQGGERVLEVGVGTGLCLPLYPKGCEIIGIDLSTAMLRKAQERVQAQKLTGVSLMRMDASNMTFPDDSFGLVVAAYVVTTVSDHRKMMKELIRVCRPGGRIALLNHFRCDSRLLAVFEKAISPLCRHLGFRTDLSVAELLDGWPLLVQRDERVKPLRMWRLVQCINGKLAQNPSVLEEEVLVVEEHCYDTTVPGRTPALR